MLHALGIAQEIHPLINYFFMKNILSNHRILLIIILALFFLMSKGFFPKILYFLITIPYALYFFPIRLFLDKEIKLINILSYFTIATTLSFSFINQYLDKDNIGIQIVLLSLLLINIFILFFDKKSSDYKNKDLHFILLVFIPLIFFL